MFVWIATYKACLYTYQLAIFLFQVGERKPESNWPKIKSSNAH